MRRNVIQPISLDDEEGTAKVLGALPEQLPVYKRPGLLRGIVLHLGSPPSGAPVKVDWRTLVRIYQLPSSHSHLHLWDKSFAQGRYPADYLHLFPQDTPEAYEEERWRASADIARLLEDNKDKRHTAYADIVEGLGDELLKEISDARVQAMLHSRDSTSSAEWNAFADSLNESLKEMNSLFADFTLGLLEKFPDPANELKLYWKLKELLRNG